MKSPRRKSLKFLSSLIAVLALPVLAYGQGVYIQNEAGATKLPTPGAVSNAAAVDPALRQIVVVQQSTPIPVAPATSALTPSPMITIVAASVPTAYGTPQFSNSSALKTVTVDASTINQETWCNYGGGSTTHFKVPAGSVYTDNMGTRGNTMSSGVACIAPIATPSAGTLAIYGSK